MLLVCLLAFLYCRYTLIRAKMQRMEYCRQYCSAAMALGDATGSFDATTFNILNVIHAFLFINLFLLSNASFRLQ